MRGEGRGGGGLVVGGQRPSFLLRRGELLHPSDLVQQLCDEVLEGRKHKRSQSGRTVVAGGRGRSPGGGAYLSGFETVHQ